MNIPLDTPSRAAGQIKVDLGAETKKAWVQWCLERSLVPGKAVRSLVEQAIEGGLELSARQGGKQIHAQVAKGADRGPKVGRELQFTPSENEAIEHAAKVEGYGFQEFVIAAVRAALVQAVSYGQHEIEALTQSNIKLITVAKELRAMRELNTVTPEKEHKDWETLENDIRKHIEKSSLAMAKGAQRWQLKI